MHGIWKAIGSFVRRADMILLSLCIAASVFGIVVISSATNVKGSAQYVRTQILALVLGIILYVFFTLVDVDIIAERRELLLIFSAIFILLLFPFGDTRSGNRSWLAFSFLPFSIQPAEICKIPFIMILAKTMSIRQNKISHISTVAAARSHHGLHVWPDRRSVGGSGCCAAVSVYFRHYGVCRRREPFVVPRRVCGAACSFSIFVAVSQLRPAQPYLGAV